MRDDAGTRISSHCRVKPVPCDQLTSLLCRRDRLVMLDTDDKQHRHVVRRILKLGGWLRADSVDPRLLGDLNGAKRVFMPPDSALPPQLAHWDNVDLEQQPKPKWSGSIFKRLFFIKS